MTGKTIPVYVEGSDIIEDIKVQIEAIEGIPQNHQHLVWRGKILEDAR